MNIEQLSKRLDAVYQYIPIQAVLADIGSDHAYLPCYAVQTGRAVRAIAGEVAEGPFQSALNQVIEADLSTKIDVRKGDGLAVISPGEVNCITIAGMGGALITRILEEGKDKLTEQTRLILQPNIGGNQVRKWLERNGWTIVNENILEEDEHIYEIICADFLKEKNERLTELEILMGPFLIKEKNQAFRQKWQGEKEQLVRVLQSLNLAKPSEETNEKKERIRHEINLIEEGLRQ
ncbi:tRNA (adenine22-N1)-methyltransferase [Bacillus oleivorans]|uniref:tRNA (Adenine22-N1)-methyltransferase n=1 Tax=Bacillus oleivorans TaxID=1448271 RepID=A0A285CJW7_9BACI|nr:tRNA (adenine(22)-N(1))-methyltransferase TrmK [Bacillus oleivorans]SNX67891.1 tRNA (adenine22-N1)-methyltransferase [Bacillus oleivorans]